MADHAHNKNAPSIKLANEIQAAIVTSDNAVLQTLPQGYNFTQEDVINYNRKILDDNRELWDAAHKFGITQPELRKNHPELLPAESDLAQSFRNAKNMTRGISLAAGIGGAAVPLTLFKQQSRLARGVIAAITGTAAAIVTFAVAAPRFIKSVGRKLTHFKQHENMALEQEIAQVASRPVIEGAPPVSVPEDARKFAAELIKKRNPDFAAQLVKETSQAGISNGPGK